MRTVQPGDQLDHYTIAELLALTNTASIYKGTDQRAGSQVAIKIPHPEVEGDPLFYQRFMREQEIYQKLDHPAIVKGFKDDKRTRVYIAMELADGQLLRQILFDERKLTAERAVRIALAICGALDYIHSSGVVHRDLKPENIIVDAQDRIKLIDFGIASQAGARRLTFGKLSQVMGTPDYIAPEQVKGKRGDARTDIYALGVILYEMLTGKTPFADDNPYVNMHNRLVNHPVPPREIEPSITPEMQEVIYRALERDPNKRYSSARDFANDLLNQDTVGVADRPELRDWKWQSKPWTKSALGYGLLAVIPIVILGLLLFVAHHT